MDFLLLLFLVYSLPHLYKERCTCGALGEEMNVSNVGNDLEMAVREESALMVTSVQEEEEEEVKGEK